MKLNTIIEKLDLEIINKGNLDIDIEKGHIGDLLSEVMRNAEEKSIWVTHQTHQNVIAVAEVVGANAVLIPEDLNYLPETLEKAKSMDINLLKTKMSGFEVTGKIYNILQK